MIEIPVAEGNSDARTLNEAMELKKCVRIAIEIDRRLGGRMWIYSDRHATRAVKFIDDSTEWEFGAIVPERIKPDVMKTAPLQAGIWGMAMRKHIAERDRYYNCYSTRVIEGVPISKRLGICGRTYLIKTSQDLTN